MHPRLYFVSNELKVGLQLVAIFSFRLDMLCPLFDNELVNLSLDYS